uniref:Uncharacterized protein n=2 Tax=Anguilla anguilla TaxID=7936 RepID=A0A0E9ULW6_ANGAN
MPKSTSAKQRAQIYFTIYNSGIDPTLFAKETYRSWTKPLLAPDCPSLDLCMFHPSIHPLSIPTYSFQGRRRCWSLSQDALGERREYTQFTH